MTVAEANLALADEVALYYHDPLGFVKFAYPWGTGSLSEFTGPDEWQTEFLRDLGREVKRRAFDGATPVNAVRMAVASGHGIGKSTLVAWVVNWIMSTRPDARGTVTANTFVQLQTKTWAAVQQWSALCITAHWFRVTGDRMYHRTFPATWFCSAQTCREENSEAFAGQHSGGSTSFYVFDEASAVPDKIFEVSEGGLIRGEPMVFLFGNPTRNTGKFHRVAFGGERPRWNHRSIDSRTSGSSNKPQIAEWLQDYGEDSDFFRVRVIGIPPHASELQWIGQDRVQAAQRNIVEPLADDPLIVGVDVSGGGAAWTVARFRRGLDARTIPPIRMNGEQGREVIIARLAAVLADRTPSRRVAMMFIDSAFGAPIVERLHLLGFENVVEVNFGNPQTPDLHFANMRSYMWNALKDWLPRGAIDRNDEKLEVDLTGPGFHINKSNKLVLEPKSDMLKRGLPPPDDADGLALTFAAPVAVAPPIDHQQQYGQNYGQPRGWMA